MSVSASARKLLLELIAEGEGSWDTRNIDVMFYVRGGGELDSSVLEAVRELEVAGLVTSIDVQGTGPGWLLTEAGREGLA